NGLNGEYGPVEFGVDRPDAGAASAADIEETGHSAADSSADAEFVQPLLIGLPQTSRAASVYGLSQSAERITGQVAESILTQALTTEQSDTITLDAILDPPDLGRVHIRLTRSESSLTAHVRAENSDVQHIIAEHGGLIEQGVRTQLRSDGVLHFALADSHLGQGSSAPGGHEPPPRPTLWTSGHRDHTRVTTARQSAGRSNAEVDVLA
ncbi:MAG: flagellar hook-length control protein FliK, partial [Planctomycetaceae bacterium]|nr:flagellar hook-length control protein FliK [Planctomycetaceae bacterium]